MVLIRNAKEIDETLITKICLSIADASLELDDACLVNGVDPAMFRRYMKGKHKYSSVARDRVKIAESKKVENLIALVKTGRNNARQLLEAIVPHYNKTFKLQLQYANRAVLHIIKNHVTDEQYYQIVRELAEQPERELLARIDNEVER